MKYFTTLVDIKSSAEPAASNSEGSMLLIGIGAGLTLLVLRGVAKAIRWAAPRLWVRLQRGRPEPDQGQDQRRGPRQPPVDFPQGIYGHPPPAPFPVPVGVWPPPGDLWPRPGSGGHENWRTRQPLREVWPGPSYTSTPASTSHGPGLARAGTTMSLDAGVARARAVRRPGGETLKGAKESEQTLYYSE